MNSSDGHSGITDMTPDTLALIGVPFDEYSSFLRGPAKAPAVIRRVLHNGASNLFAENGIDLDDHPGFCDLGDLTLPRRRGCHCRHPGGHRKTRLGQGARPGPGRRPRRHLSDRGCRGNRP